MAIITQPDLLPEGSVAVTIGMFDGVHRGHVWLIDCLKRFAAERHLTPAVVTFREHPRNVLCGEGHRAYNPDGFHSELVEARFRRVYEPSEPQLWHGSGLNGL